LVKNDQNGWLIPAGDSDALTASMQALLNADSEQLSAMGRDGHNAVKRLHNIQLETAKLAEYFKEGLA